MQSDALIKVFTTAPEPAAKPTPAATKLKEAPAVKGAAQIPNAEPNATTPTETTPDVISPTISTTICCPWV